MHKVQAERAARGGIHAGREAPAIVGDAHLMVFPAGSKLDGEPSAPASGKCVLECIDNQFVGDEAQRNGRIQIHCHRIKPQYRLEWEEGDVVRIVSGPFADFTGTIAEINVEQSKLRVMVNIFDRETPVELAFDQVAKA